MAEDSPRRCRCRLGASTQGIVSEWRMGLSSKAATRRLNLAPEGKSLEAKGKVIELEVQGRKVSVPVWVQPGHAEDSITVFLGYGRSRAGHIGSGIGYSAYPLRSVDSPWIIMGAKAAQTSGFVEIATT